MVGSSLESLARVYVEVAGGFCAGVGLICNFAIVALAEKLVKDCGCQFGMEKHG